MDSVNIVNVKKTPVVVKGKQAAHAPANQAPLTLPEDMINRNSALTPSVYGDAETSQVNTSTVLSDKNSDVPAGPPPRPDRRRQHQSNDDRANHVPANMARPLNPAMNSTV